MSSASPITVVDDAIVIEYGQFLIQDLAGHHLAGRLPVDPKSAWRMVAGAGGALFHSDSMDREVPVRLELWNTEPPPPTEPWKPVADGVMQPDSTQVRLRSTTGAVTPHVLSLDNTRAHHVRASLQITIDSENADEYETDIQETWLIQLWPDDTTPDTPTPTVVLGTTLD